MKKSRSPFLSCPLLAVVLPVVLPIAALAAKSDVTVHPITIVLDFENSHDHVPLQIMERELQNLLSNARISVNLLLRDELASHPQFGELLVFKMKGHCSTTELPIGAVLDERGPLAMTYSSDGEMLSFGEVECDRVRLSLQRLTGHSYPELHSVLYGRALGRVVAHEMYHMLVSSTSHTGSGLTKESLSPKELAEEPMQFSNQASQALRKALAFR